MRYTKAEIAKSIDHSLLRPDLTDQEVIDGCAVAANLGAKSVCVKPCHVALAAKCLTGSDVLVGTVIGFPHGNSSAEVKAFEAATAVRDGAVELDMVINIGALKSGRADDVRDEIRQVVLAGGDQAIVKVIIENAYLTEAEKVVACHLVEEAGAAFVKTSTGFAPSGATLEDIRLMRREVSDKVQVKAAGGIRTLPVLVEFLDAGATRIGATATAAILDAYDGIETADAGTGY